MQRVALRYRAMKSTPLCATLALLGSSAFGQIQVDLRLGRLQYVAYEPVVATVGITNLAGRDVAFRDVPGQFWFGFEVTGQDGQTIGPAKTSATPPPLKLESR